MGLVRMLSDVFGFDVVGEAASGEEALLLSRSLSPDVILMDVKMPGIGGGPSFAFFAVMMIVHFFFAWKILPETKGKSLEEIQVEMARRNKNSN